MHAWATTRVQVLYPTVLLLPPPSPPPPTGTHCSKLHVNPTQLHSQPANQVQLAPENCDTGDGSPPAGPLDMSDSKGVNIRKWHKLVCCSTRERWDEEETVHNCTYLACLEVAAKAFTVEASDGEYRRPAQTVGLTQSE